MCSIIHSCCPIELFRDDSNWTGLENIRRRYWTEEHYRQYKIKCKPVFFSGVWDLLFLKCITFKDEMFVIASDSFPVTHQVRGLIILFLLPFLQVLVLKFCILVFVIAVLNTFVYESHDTCSRFQIERKFSLLHILFSGEIFAFKIMKVILIVNKNVGVGL